MTATDSNYAAKRIVKDNDTVSVGPSDTLPSSEKPPVLPNSKNHNIRVSSSVIDAAGQEADQLLRSLQTTPQGLTQSEAENRAKTIGPNEVPQERRRGWFLRLLIIVRNPLVILLTVLASISFATSDARAGTVMAGMVVLSVALRFVQEARADTAAAKLKEMIHVTATVVRDGKAFLSGSFISGDDVLFCTSRDCHNALSFRAPAELGSVGKSKGAPNEGSSLLPKEVSARRVILSLPPLIRGSISSSRCTRRNYIQIGPLRG